MHIPLTPCSTDLRYCTAHTCVNLAKTRASTANSPTFEPTPASDSAPLAEQSLHFEHVNIISCILHFKNQTERDITIFYLQLHKYYPARSFCEAEPERIFFVYFLLFPKESIINISFRSRKKEYLYSTEAIINAFS